MAAQQLLRLGASFPNLEVKTTAGNFKFLDWKGKESWALLFSHPRDFTPVCTTELGRAVKLNGEFEKRNCKLIGLSCDSIESHRSWAQDVLSLAGCGAGDAIPFPMIEDPGGHIGHQLGMMDIAESRVVGMPLTCRGVFVVGPDDNLKMYMFYPATTGRNFDELLRVLDSLQLTYDKKVATPANWKPGDRVMITPAANEQEAKEIDPNFEVAKVPSGKGYIRFANMKK